MKKLLFPTLVFLLSFPLLFAQEKGEEEKKEDIPNPVELEQDWWDFFNVQQSQLPKKIYAYQDYLDRLIQQIPEKEREKFSNLIKRIKNNLTAYEELKLNPPEIATTPPSYADAYTIEDLMELNRELRQERLSLENLREDLEERENRILSAADRYNTLWKEYVLIDTQTEEKLVKGLELINLKLSLEIAAATKDQLQRRIESSLETVDQVEKEMDVAFQRLSGNVEKYDEFVRKANEAKQAREEAVKKLKNQEAEIISRLDYSAANEKAKLRNEILNLELTGNQIEASIAENQAILSEMKLQLARFLTSPNLVDEDRIDQKVSEWNSALEQIEENASDWNTNLHKDLARAEEWLSINAASEDPAVQELIPIQKRILTLTQDLLVDVFTLRNELLDSEFLYRTITREVDIQQNGFYSYFIYAFDSTAHVFNVAIKWLNRPLFKIGNSTIRLLGIVQFIAILLIAFWITRIVDIGLNQIALKRQGVRKSLIYRVNRLVHYFILALGILIALTFLGFDFSNLVIIAGALGVGLGFGLQAIFNNFVCGIMILFENQLKVGDYVELESGVKGEVREINFRSTYVKTNDGIAIVIPNSEFINGRVINWTLKDPYRRVQVHFSVAYDSDKELVKEVVKEAVLKVPITLKKSWAPEPRVFITELGANSIEFKCSVWVDDKATKRSSFTQSYYLWAIHDALTQNGVKIPFPQHDLHLNSIFEMEKSEEFKKYVEEISKIKPG